MTESEKVQVIKSANETIEKAIQSAKEAMESNRLLKEDIRREVRNARIERIIGGAIIGFLLSWFLLPH